MIYEAIKYPDGWWITYLSTTQNKRIKSHGPYKQKSFAELDIEVLNNKYKKINDKTTPLR